MPYNALCHIAKRVKVISEEENIHVMKLPTQSHDVNPIDILGSI